MGGVLDDVAAIAAVGAGGAIGYQVLTDVLTIANLSVSLAVGIGGLVLLYCRIRYYMKKDKP